MTKYHEEEFGKIERVSRILEIVFGLALLLTIFCASAIVFLATTSPTSTGESYVRRAELRETEELSVTDDHFREGLLTASDKVKTCVVVVLYASCLALCFWFVIKLMGQFRKGNVFSAASVVLAKRAAYSYAGSVLVLTVVTSVGAIMLGGFRLNGAMSKNFVIVGMCSLFVWIIQIGTTLYADHELTV